MIIDKEKDKLNPTKNERKNNITISNKLLNKTGKKAVWRDWKGDGKNFTFY